jgi:predicted MFS family arabinose efflux permease
MTDRSPATLGAARNALAASRRALWRNRDYMILWSGQAVSVLGSNITTITLPLLVLSLTHSALQAGIVGALYVLPYPVIGLLAGALVDRWDRRTVMISSDAGNALAMASIPLALWLGHVAMPQLYAVALATGTCNVFFTLAQSAALPIVVGKEQLPAAMAQNQSSLYAATLAGPPLAGALFQAARAVPFLLDAVSYVVSVLSLLFIRTSFQGARESRQGSVWSQIGEGWLWLWRHPLLRSMTVLITGINFLSAGLTLIVIVLARQQHAPPFAIGAVFAIGAGGGGLGSLLAPWVQRRFSLAGVIAGTSWLRAGFWILYLAAPNAAVLGIVTALLFTTVPISIVVGNGYRAAIVPDHLQGRVLAAYRVIAFGASPLGLALTGVLLQSAGTTMTITAVSAGMGALAGFATLNRSIQTAPPLIEARAA